MTIEITDLEKVVNSGLTTKVKDSKINFGQLFIEIGIEDLYSSILFLKTNEKCKFKQLIDITAVDYPDREQRFNIVYKSLNFKRACRNRFITKIWSFV